MQKEIVRYKREDGLDLNATLYLPPGYERERDGRLPCLLWAYPREYKSRVRAHDVIHATTALRFAGLQSSAAVLLGRVATAGAQHEALSGLTCASNPPTLTQQAQVEQAATPWRSAA